MPAKKKPAAKKAKTAAPKIKTLPAPKLDAKAAVRELSTVRDFIRYAIGKFQRADLFYGHGTFSPFDGRCSQCWKACACPSNSLDRITAAKLLAAEEKKRTSPISSKSASRPASRLRMS